jgi:hypothetical protein
LRMKSTAIMNTVQDPHQTSVIILYCVTPEIRLAHVEFPLLGFGLCC